MPTALPQRRLPRTFFLLLWILAALTLAGCGTTRNVLNAGSDPQLMLRGNDPVAYFNEGRPTAGKPELRAEHEGLSYRFASETNRNAFLQNPQKFVPAYGGFCAAGAPYALKAAIGADTFKVVDGRLFLFGSEKARRNWEMDEKHNIELGDHYWEKETRDVPFRVQNFKRYVFRVPHYKTDQQLEAEWQARSGRKAGG